MLLVPAGSGPRGPGGHLGILGREKQTLPWLWPESSNSRKQLGGTPREEGASPFPPVGPFLRRNGNQTQNSQRLRKGSFSRTRPGSCWGLHLSVVGKEGAGAGWRGPPGRGTSAQGCPSPYSLGPLLFASCCLPWQPARSRDLTAFSLPGPLRPEPQGPGGKEDATDWKVQTNTAGVEDEKEGDSGLATSLFLPQLSRL